MAVRIFDLTEPQSSRLTTLEAAPRRRRDVRRAKQRWAIIGVVTLAIPFLTAFVVLGVAH